MSKDISSITLTRVTGFYSISAYQVKNMVDYILDKLPECSLSIEIQKTNNTRYTFNISNIGVNQDGYIAFAMYEVRHFLYRITSNLDESTIARLFDFRELSKFNNSYLKEILDAFNSNKIFKEYFTPFKDLSMNKPFYSYSEQDKFNSLFHVSEEYVNNYQSGLIKNFNETFIDFEFKQLIHAFIKDDLSITYMNTFHIGDSVIFFDMESNKNYIVQKHNFKEYKAIYSREEMFQCKVFEPSDIDLILKSIVSSRLKHSIYKSVDIEAAMTNDEFVAAVDLLHMTVY